MKKLDAAPELFSSLESFIVGLRHVGHIVDDLSAAIDAFKMLYSLNDDAVRVEPPFETGQVATRFAFIRVADIEFELIQAYEEPFLALLSASERGQGGINHIAWTVTNIEQAVATLASKGVQPGHVTPNGIVQFTGRKMVYLDPASCGGLLVELVEDLI